MDSSKLVLLSNNMVTHNTIESASESESESESDTSLTENNQTLDSATDSDDDGSVLSLPTIQRPHRQYFPYVFRSDSEVDFLLKTCKSGGSTDSVKNPGNNNSDAIQMSRSLLDQSILHRVLLLDNTVMRELDSRDEANDSDDSGSLESVGSDEGSDLESDEADVITAVPLVQSIVHKRKKASSRSSNSINQFGNHALLRYHFKDGIPQTSISVQSSHTTHTISQSTMNVNAASVPPRKMGRQYLALETQEEKDAYIIQRVSRWHSSGKGSASSWYGLAKRMNTTTHAVRKRWEEISQSAEMPSAVCLSSTGDSTPANNVLEETVNEPSTSLQRELVAQAETIEVIDLTYTPDVDPTEPKLPPEPAIEEIVHVPRLKAELVSYIIACVHDQTWLLRRRDGMQPLWRQLGVELGLTGRELDALWRQTLSHAYVAKYGYGHIGTRVGLLNLSIEKNAWLSDRVRAWKGRGRGLWEGLGSTLGFCAVQVMSHWDYWTTLKAQYECVEAACIHSRGASVASNIIVNNSSSAIKTDSLSPALIRRISLLIFVYYTDTLFVPSVESFWNNVSEHLNLNPLTLATQWKQVCVKSYDSDVFIPVIPVQGVRAFTPTHDQKLIDFVHGMRRRWNKTDFAVIGHALSASEYMLRARWYCFIRPQEFRYFHYFYNSSLSVQRENGHSTVSTGRLRANSICSAADPVVSSLVFDMVNTVSITAKLDSATIGAIYHNIRKAWANGKRVEKTITFGHKLSLNDSEVAVVIAAVTAWNAGTSAATTEIQLWHNIAWQLKHKYVAEPLSAWWSKLCQTNPHSQMIVCPIDTPITASYLVSTFAKLTARLYGSTYELLMFLKCTPEAKHRWCQFLSHRPGNVYKIMHAQRRENVNRPDTHSYMIGECVADIVSALELTERMDGYLAPQSVVSTGTKLKREDSKTRSAVNVVLRGIVCDVVKKALPKSAQILHVCTEYKRLVTCASLPSRFPKLKRPPPHSDVRRILLLCFHHANKTSTSVNWTVLSSLLRIAVGELCVLWLEVQSIVSIVRNGRYVLNTLEEQLELL